MGTSITITTKAGETRFWKGHRGSAMEAATALQGVIDADTRFVWGIPAGDDESVEMVPIDDVALLRIDPDTDEDKDAPE